MRILLTWELGAGHGHWANLLPIVQRLAQRNCEVFAALRDVTVTSGSWQRPAGMVILPAPRYSNPGPKHPEPRTFVRVLERVGYRDPEALTQLIAAWGSLYELVKPDVIVCEYAPTALLAARGWPAKTIVVGTGFYSPPNLTPLPDLQYWDPLNATTLVDEEAQLLARINGVLDRLRLPPLSSFGQWFAEVDENILLTLPELDHYDLRPGATYWGVYRPDIPTAPWPDLPPSDRPSVFAYLKPHPLLPSALQAIQAAGCRVIAHIPGIDDAIKRQLASKSLAFTTGPVDLADAAKHSHAAVLNGNLATATALLLHGLPTVNIPLHMEQLVTCHRMTDLGVARWSRLDQPQAIHGAIADVLGNSRYAKRAIEFSEQRPHYATSAVKKRVLDHLARVIAVD